MCRIIKSRDAVAGVDGQSGIYDLDVHLLPDSYAVCAVCIAFLQHFGSTISSSVVFAEETIKLRRFTTRLVSMPALGYWPVFYWYGPSKFGVSIHRYMSMTV